MEVTYTAPEVPAGTVTIVLTEAEARSFLRLTAAYYPLRDALRKEITAVLAAGQRRDV